MDKIFFTADTHFGHESTLKWEEPAWSIVEERDETIIRRWNETVGPTDTVYHLGDFAFRNARPVKEYRTRLNGHILLVPGNHDIPSRGGGKKRRELEECLEVLPDLVAVRLFRQKIVLCHYPMRSWRGSHHGTWHLHGHSHGDGTPWRGSIDVGIMNHGYRPLCMTEVAALLSPFEGVSHHA